MRGSTSIQVSFLLCFLFFSLPNYGQERYKRTKPDQDYFQKLEQYNDHDVLVIEDFTTISNQYNKEMFGATDKSFTMSATRNIRVRLNNVAASGKQLKIWLTLGGVSANDLVFDNLNVYSYKNGKIKKTTVKQRSVQIAVENDYVLLDLTSTGIQDGSIVDIAYSVNKIAKDGYKWMVKTAYFTLSATFLSIIPQIYSFDINLLGQADLKELKKSTKGVLLGYRVPDPEQETMLIKPKMYQQMQDRGEGIRDVEEVFCKNFYRQFSVKEVQKSSDDDSARSGVILTLKNVDYIVK